MRNLIIGIALGYFFSDVIDDALGKINGAKVHHGRVEYHAYTKPEPAPAPRPVDEGEEPTGGTPA